jgi:uncharacterized OB-fold protein
MATATAEKKDTAPRATVEKFDNCPKCGFAFTQPQTKCMSTKACEKRQAAKTATPGEVHKATTTKAKAKAAAPKKAAGSKVTPISAAS